MVHKLVSYYFSGSLPGVLVWECLASPVTSITLQKVETGAALSKLGSRLIHVL